MLGFRARLPAMILFLLGCGLQLDSPTQSSVQGTQQLRIPQPEPESVIPVTVGLCKAENNMCNIERQDFIESSPAQPCDICCTEPGFCDECCCVLCRKMIDCSVGGYSYIKCEAIMEDNYICGHVAHLYCALRDDTAGTIGGSVGLDGLYCCRRCDNKTNLMMHVEKLLETCKYLKSRDEIEPILNLGLGILRGSRQIRANNLEEIMGSAMAKLTCSVDIVEVWNMEGYEGRATSNAGENSSPANGVTIFKAQQVPEEAALQGHPDLIDPIVDNKLAPAIGVTVFGAQQVSKETAFQGHLDLIDPLVDNKLAPACGVTVFGAQQVSEEATLQGHPDQIDPLVDNKLAPAIGVTVFGAQQVPKEAALQGHPDLIDPLVDNKLAPASGVTVFGAQQVPEEAALQGHPDLIDPLVDNKLAPASGVTVFGAQQVPKDAAPQGHPD